MTTFRVHTLESAPEGSKPALQGLKQAFGMVPNLAATMAEAPALVNSFVGSFGNFHGGTFSEAERQVLLLSNAVTNRCTWAVAFHSTLALKAGVEPEDVAAIRERRLPSDGKLAALSALTRAFIEKRGHLDERDSNSFFKAGFRGDQLLEVVTGIAVSTMANYAGNVTQPPLEEPFRAQAWTAPAL